VPLPEPVPGLAIRYSYLWFSEHLEGREEGAKERPCAVVAAIRSDEVGEMRVLVLPVTHRPPAHAQLCVEIPARVKDRLGPDAERAWVVISEWNEFTWPGPDLRRVPGADETSVVYGMLPPGLFSSIRDKVLALAGGREARRVRRTG